MFVRSRFRVMFIGLNAEPCSLGINSDIGIYIYMYQLISLNIPISVRHKSGVSSSRKSDTPSVVALTLQTETCEGVIVFPVEHRVGVTHRKRVEVLVVIYVVGLRKKTGRH